MIQFKTGPADLAILGIALDGPLNEPVRLDPNRADPSWLWAGRVLEERALSTGPVTLGWPVQSSDLLAWQEAMVARRDSTYAGTLRYATEDQRTYRTYRRRLVPGTEQVWVDGQTLARADGPEPGPGEYVVRSYPEGLVRLPEGSVGLACTIEYRYWSDQWLATQLPQLNWQSDRVFEHAAITASTYILDYAVDLGTYGLVQAYYAVQPYLADWNGLGTKLVRLGAASLASCSLGPFSFCAQFPGSAYNGWTVHWFMEPQYQCLRLDLGINRYRVRSLEWHFTKSSALSAGQGPHYYPTYQQLIQAVRRDVRLPLLVDYPTDWAGSLCTALFSASTCATFDGGRDDPWPPDPAQMRAWLAEGLAAVSETDVVWPVGIECGYGPDSLFPPVLDWLAWQQAERRSDRALVVCEFAGLDAVRTVQGMGLGQHLVVAAGTLLNLTEGQPRGPAGPVAAVLARAEAGLVQIGYLARLAEPFSLGQLEQFRTDGVLALHETWGRGILAYANVTVGGWNPLHIRQLQRWCRQAQSELTGYIGTANWLGLEQHLQQLAETWRQMPLVQDLQYQITSEPDQNRARLSLAVRFYQALDYIRTDIWLGR